MTYTRGSDLSGSLEGAGGIGGLLGRSQAYQTGSGNWTNHNFYHADGNGNVTYMLNSAQSRVAEYGYDPYGNTISSARDAGQGERVSVLEQRGDMPTADSRLYYYGYRFYDPHLQRWPNRDPIEEQGGINLYAYVKNNPINLTDPDGLTCASKGGSSGTGQLVAGVTIAVTATARLSRRKRRTRPAARQCATSSTKRAARVSKAATMARAERLGIRSLTPSRQIRAARALR